MLKTIIVSFTISQHFNMERATLSFRNEGDQNKSPEPKRVIFTLFQGKTVTV
jgi:hypothetical protein